MADLLATLLDAPGVYVGPIVDFGDPPDERNVAIGRIEVRVLPGGGAVSIDYEGFSRETGRFHAEHSILGRTPAGLVLVVSHVHADTVLVLHEDGAGRFVDRDKTSRFPVEHLIETPEPGRLIHHWRFGPPGGEIGERDTADVRLVTS